MILLLAWGLAVTVHVLGMTAAARLAREPVREAGLFVGPRLFGARVLGVSLRVGLVPLGGWVALRRELRDLPTARAVFLAVAGPLALLGLGALTLGVSQAAAEVGRGFGQVFLGALSPQAFGASALLALHDLATRDGFAPLGVIAAKLAAFNLLPLPGLNGAVLLDRVTRRLPLPQAARERVSTLGLGVLGLLLLGWALALALAVINSR